jgi:alpha-tubulin suppressor-like RCC1 family protein
MMMCCLIVSFASEAFSQINYPLPGRAIIKLLPDNLRPQIYALNQASGSVPGTLLALNSTNGAIINEITVNTNPTDMAMTPASDALYVINAGSRTISKVDLNSFTVVSEKQISTPNTYAISNPLHLTASESNLVYFTDGAWAPNIYAFDYNAGTNLFEYSGTAYIDYENNATPNGVGGLITTRNGSTLYTWLQYGWGAGSSESVITHLMVGTNTLLPVEYGPLQYRDPLDTPILLDASEKWIFNKVQMVSATNVSVLLNQFSDNVYAITPDGSIAFGPTEVFDTRTGAVILNLSSSATVQTVSGDQTELFRYNATTTNLVIYDLISLLSPKITQQPTSQTIYNGNNATVSFGVTGLAPLTYLWFFNGTNVAVTTTNWLTISNFQSTNVGNYNVIITNVMGSTASSNFTLLVTNGAPIILTQPASQAEAASFNAVFSVQIAGSLPVSFQWQFNGTNISGGTNQVLTLTYLQLTNQGSYDVIITNAYGSATSSNAYLAVMDVNAALNTTNLIWSTSGDMPWFVQPNPATYDLWGFGFSATHDGISSMQSGNTTAGQQSILSTIVNGPATLNFWWQTASISSSDFLTFSFNGQGQSSIGGKNYWQQQTFYLGAGTNLLVWDYETDADPLNRAQAWLDQVNMTPGGTPPFVTIAPVGQIVSINSNATMSVTANGTPPFTYQWRLNGTNIATATNSTFTLSNLQLADAGYYDAVVGNGFGVTNSSSAYLNVVDPVAALNDTNLTWTTGGDVPWFVETATTYDGFAALQSGAIIANQQSTVQTTVTGPGTLTFWWNVSSEAVNDYLNFSINGTEQARISGNITGGFYGWQQQTNYIGAGDQTLQWDYIKTDSGVSNSGRDSGWLDEVSFTPGGTPPFITLNPTNQVILVGSNATLNATAQGTPPLYYQWQLNLTNLDGATNASLTFTNAQFTNEGNYSLIITNAFGITNTTSVYLNMVDFTESLNATNLTWTSGGNLPWFPETSTTHDGIAALQSGAITGSQQSTVQTTVNGPGILSFWWQISSETNNDYANFSFDGSEQFRISGTVKWQQISYAVASGTHTLTWSYSKNATINTGSDAAWLDQVNYAPGATMPSITTNPANITAKLGQAVSFLVTALGTPPLYYQWQFSGTNIPSATNAVLNLPPWSSEGSYSVVISNAFGMVTSSNATLTTPRTQIVPWGANGFGQTNIPGNLGNVLAIAAGDNSSLALKSDGTVRVWGDNTYGETNVPAGLSNVVAIAAGEFNDCLALESNGKVVGWGYNSYGQTNIPAGLSNVMAIAAGANDSIVLQSNGQVKVWGYNSNGQTNVPAGLSNVVAIAAGANHVLALQGSSQVVAWGNNSSHQTNVPASLTNAIAIAAGSSSSLALQSNGTVTAWGDNTYGQTNVPANLTNAVAIAAGFTHNLALRNDGTVVAWGNNGSGQTNVPVGLNKVVGIAGGQYHSLALVMDGPPLITPQPLNQTAYAGLPIVFTANALGLQPIVYQWQWNGTNIVGATNVSLSLTNVQPANAGIYNLIVSNSYGLITSSNAILTVNTNPPTLAVQPTNQIASASSNAFFNATAVGPVPFTYQWQFGGANIAGATNGLLSLTNVQPFNQGVYDVVISNSYGFITSSNATLTVTGTPPSIVSIQPAYQTLVAGSNFSFTATANGSPPLSYQWQFYGTNIVGATNATLALLNVQSASEGSYDVVVTNYFGSVTSSNAQLISLSTALNAPGLIWTNSGNATWFVETNTTYDGVVAAQSGAVGNGQQSLLQTTVTGPGTLTFWWDISSFGTLSFSINGLQLGSIRISTGWQQRTFYLGAGTQTLAWNYAGSSIFFGANAAWLDQISFIPGGTAPIITSASTNSLVNMNANAAFSVGATGTPPLAYQWQFSETNILNQTNPMLTLLNVQPANSGIYSVVITNNYGSISTNVTLFVQPFSLNTGSTNLMMTTNGFQLLLNGVLTTNPVIILQSTDLVNWLPIYTNPATTGSIQFLDVTATNLPAGFYRAQE